MNVDGLDETIYSNNDFARRLVVFGRVYESIATTWVAVIVAVPVYVAPGIQTGRGSRDKRQWSCIVRIAVVSRQLDGP